MNNLKNSKGISLIVLIISIIVMIILATAIILSLSNSGIIGKANKATYEHEVAREKEQILLSVSNVMLDELSSSIQYDALKSELEDSWKDIQSCEKTTQAEANMLLVSNNDTSNLKTAIDAMIVGGRKENYMKVTYDTGRIYYVSLDSGEIIDDNVFSGNASDESEPDDEVNSIPEVGPVPDGQVDPAPGTLETDSNGTYWIYSIEDLVAFSYNVNTGATYNGKTIKLGRNLDFTGDDEKSYVDVTTLYTPVYDENLKLLGYVPATGETENSKPIQELMITGMGFAPIGGTFVTVSNTSSQANVFQGVFDGNFHKLINLYENYTDAEHVGLFGFSNAAITIQNLEINNSNITWSTENDKYVYLGGIIGLATNNTVLENCKLVDSNITTIYNEDCTASVYCAGLIGNLASGSNSIVKNCRVTGCDITAGHGSYVSGMIGMSTCNNVYLENNYLLNSNITLENALSENAWVGGIVGDAPTGIKKVEKCYAKNSTIKSANGYVGGLAGRIQFANIIGNCYVDNINIQGNAVAIGAIVGQTIYTAKIANCSSAGEISATASKGIGGIVGDNIASNISECISSVNCSSNANKGVAGIMGCCSGAAEVNIDYCMFTGKINNYSCSAGIAGSFNGGTINITNCVNYGNNSSNSSTAGIFITFDTCSNINISNCANYSDISSVNCSGIIVKQSSTSGPLSVDNCYNYGNVTSNGTHVGGVIDNTSAVSLAKITNTTNYGNITGGNTGGLVGYGPSDMTNCYNYGNIKGSYSTGGLQGNGGTSSVTIINCHNKGIVEGGNTAYTGGVIGDGSGNISNSSNTSEIRSTANNTGGIVGYYGGGTIDGCFNEGKISSTGGYMIIGGILGGTSSSANTIITNCYNTSDLDGGTSVAGITPSGKGSIINCYNTGKISTSSTNAIGGIVAEFSGNITNCLNYGVIDCSKKSLGNAGGIVGNSYSGTVSRCYNLGNIVNGENGQGIGGIGGNAKSVELSYNSGNIEGNHIGGIGNVSSVTYCHNEGVLTLAGSSITEYYAYMGRIMTYSGSVAGEGCTYYTEDDSITLDISNGATRVDSKIMTMDFVVKKLNEYASENEGLKTWNLNQNNIPSFSIN